MADYHTPTVVQPDVPEADMTPLERLLLESMFQSEVHGDSVYFFAELAIDQRPFIEKSALRYAYESSRQFDSRVTEAIGALLKNFDDADDGEELEVHLSDLFDDSTDQVILQDIVRRSAAIEWFTVVKSYCCSKMRSDGFGGSACLIADDVIRFQSTDDLIEQWIGEEKLGMG